MSTLTNPLVVPDPLTTNHLVIARDLAERIVELLARPDYQVKSYAISSSTYSGIHEDCEFIVGNTKLAVRLQVMP